MKLLVFFLCVVITEMLILVLLPKTHVVDIINQERQHALTWFGDTKTKEMITNANSLFSSMFVSTGLVDGSKQFFIKHRNKKYKKGWQELSDASFFDMLSGGAEKVWLVINSGMLRLQIMWVCLILSMSFIIPSLFDGLVKRSITKHGEANASSIIYKWSTYVFSSCFALPFILLFWPLSITPLYMVFWTILLALTIWLLALNFQHLG